MSNTAIKAKAHAVTIDGKLHLVMAQTKAGAIRDVVAELVKELVKDAHCDLATGEQLYAAGRDGTAVIGSDRFKRQVDPNQMPLAGIPETADEC
jgi:predicted neutral ceramidase superfamily lipid hydrolase